MQSPVRCSHMDIDATTSASIIMAFMVMVSAARQYILRRIFERWWHGKENEVSE